MNIEEKIQLYRCIKRQFTDTGLYKMSRIYEWLFTNGYSLDKLGCGSIKELCANVPEVFEFQDDPNSEFVLVKSWQVGDNNYSDENLHPADRFFGTKNIILNDDIIEITQQSLYALTKMLGCNQSVQLMKQEIFQKFEDAKRLDKLEFFGDKYVFPIGYCSDGYPVNGIITKNLNTHGKSLYFAFEKSRSSGVFEKKQAVTPEIPEKERMRIYVLLSSNFPLNQPIHMAAVSKYLTDCGVDRTKYGYYKMKDFLSRLDFLELTEIVLGGVPQFLVTVKDQLQKGRPVKYTPSSSQRDSDNKRNSIQKLQTGELTDFCNLPAKPMMILDKYIKENGQYELFGDLTQAISEDFVSARGSGAVRIHNGRLVFPCRFKKSDGTNIELTLKQSAFEGKAWFLYYVDIDEGEGKSSANDFLNQLERFAILENWQEKLSELAALAINEEWDFPNSRDKSYEILNLYLRFTFSRIMREKKLKISFDRKLAAFNTGLTDKRYEDIYACFTPNDGVDQEWRLAGFCTADSDDFGIKLIDAFKYLPYAPVYFARNADMIFDSDKYLRIDYERLLSDNINRLPLSFLYEHLLDDSKAREAVEEIRSERDGYERLRQFERLSNIIFDDINLSDKLQICLKKAVELANKRAKRSCKAAVPLYLPTRDSVALMIPLAFNDENTPDAALVLETTRSGNYQAQTLLSLSQAYIYARLIGCLSTDWLLSSQINAISAEGNFDILFDTD